LSDLNIIYFKKNKNPKEKIFKNNKILKVEKLLKEVWIKGTKVQENLKSLKEAREFCLNQVQNFNPKILDSNKPAPYKIFMTKEYYEFMKKT
jgi:hypothetical protein